MSDPIRIEAIKKYISQYQNQFPPASLEEALLKAGYTKEEIQEASGPVTPISTPENTFVSAPTNSNNKNATQKYLIITAIVLGALGVSIGGFFAFKAVVTKTKATLTNSINSSGGDLVFSQYAQWPGELNSNSAKARLARAYLIARLGDVGSQSVNKKEISQTKLYKDNGVEYLAVRLNDGSEGVEAFSKDSNNYAALAYALFDKSANTKFNSADSSNQIIGTPSKDLVKKLELALEALRPEIEQNGMKNIPTDLNSVEWYSTQHSSSMPADLFSMGKSICIKRPDGWTQISLHLNDGSQNFSGYRNLSIITDQNDKVMAIIFAPSVTVKKGL